MSRTVVRIYTIVWDNDHQICVDNDGNIIYIAWQDVTEVQTDPVKLVRRQLFPCIKCKWKNSRKFPLTPIHQQQQNRQDYLPNVNSGQGQDQGFSEYIGECADFEQLK